MLFRSSARIARAGQKKQALLQVRNLVLFGLMSMVAMLILLWPMVSRILAYSYAERYSYYNGGGFVAEISLQFWRMGLMNLVLVGMGLWFSLKKRKMPALPCLAGLEILLSMLLFTRIQNTGSHQMLLFLPGGFSCFCWAQRRWRRASAASGRQRSCSGCSPSCLPPRCAALP